MALGPMMSAMGILSIIGLIVYIRFVARVVRTVLPRPAASGL